MSQHQIRPFDEDLRNTLETAGFNPLVARVLASRGVSLEEATSQNIKHLLNPAGLKGIHEACEIIATSLLNREKIVISSDFDVDGATAAAIGVRGLQMILASMEVDPDIAKQQVDFVVPNRFTHGYGLGVEIVELIKAEKNPALILTVDNGISSIDGVRRAKELGMRVVVTDHHLPGDETPDADAIVNPNQRGCSFQSKNLAGCGVMFYTLIYLRSMLIENGYIEQENSPRLDRLFDLVALGTVADVVKLDLNNRILVEQGLNRIRNGFMNEGVRALFKVAGKDPSKAVVSDFGFALGPRINSAGRLADMTVGIRLLLSDSAFEAERLAQTLHEMNVQRKKIEGDMKKEAEVSIQDFKFKPERNGIVVCSRNFHHGVIGITASRIKEQVYRPTIVFAPEDDPTLLRGSGRSIEGVHLRDVIDLVSKRMPSDAVVRFGGHGMAAGLVIRANYLGEFEEAFDKAIGDLSDPSVLKEVILTDGEIESSLINTETASSLSSMIWGQGFLPPVFSDTFNVKDQKILKEKHTKLFLEKDGKMFDAILWNSVEVLPPRVNLSYRIEVNTFKGDSKVQLMIDRILMNPNPKAEKTIAVEATKNKKRTSNFTI